MSPNCCAPKTPGSFDESRLRKRIQDVRNNHSLSLKEKTLEIQTIMMSGSSSYCSETSCQSGPPSKKPAPPPHNTAKTCEHYVKSCSQLYFSCCGVIDPCHRCHIERGCEVTPAQVTSVTCNACDTKQPPGRVCINTTCETVFSANHCSDCQVWTQSEIHHCDGCGLCRVGNADSLFHCDKCEACFHISTKESHICTVLSMKHQRCPLCLEATHSSQQRCVILRCGHVGHYDCLQQAWSHDRGMVPKCPTCRKSLLPPESMRAYWDAIRSSIELQPISYELMAINVGDEVSSPYGQFVVDRIVAAPRKSPCEHGDSSGPVSNLYHGRLIGWQLVNGQAATAALQLHCLKKDLMVTISCNDCEKRSTSSFHFLGMECRRCKGYNTARV